MRLVGVIAACLPNANSLPELVSTCRYLRTFVSVVPQIRAGGDAVWQRARTSPWTTSRASRRAENVRLSAILVGAGGARRDPEATQGDQS